MSDEPHSIWRSLLTGPLAKYVVVGGIGYLVNLVAFVAGMHAGLDEYAALAPAFLANTVSNFELNRRWTFSSRGDACGQLGRFCVVAAVLLGTNYTTFHLFFSLLGLSSVAAQTLSIIVGVPIGFGLNRVWTFAPRGSSSTRDQSR